MFGLEVEVRRGPGQHLGRRRAAEDARERLVATQDAPLDGEEDDAGQVALEEEPVALLRSPQRLVAALALGDVRVDAQDADDLALSVAPRPLAGFQSRRRAVPSLVRFLHVEQRLAA